MKALFFGQDSNQVEQLALTLRIRWPDLESIMVTKGSQGLMAIEQREPDIAFMCEDLTDMSMYSAISEIRKFSDIPIIAMTGDDEMEGVKVLDLGGDDYITPGTNMMVMMVKVVAIMRRFNLVNRRTDESPIQCGDLVINPATFEVYLGSTSLRLTPTEFRLLHLLAKNRHITLSQEQQTKLNQIKQQSLAGQATYDRWIAEAEQELWILTSSDAPDVVKIEAKVREVEKLRGDKRIAFIRAVGEAAQVLTGEQRQTLVGMLPPDHAAAGVGNQN